jgi:dihydroorotate dehydrogenase electron transfer subunit
MKNFQLSARILSQRRIKDNYWHCELAAPLIAKHAGPGQFINIRVSDTYDPLLRRPLSIHGVNGTKIKIFYKVVGKATEILARKKKGELLDIIGPLGNGFAYGKRKTENGKQILVAGGMGVAPLMFLAERLKKTTIQVLVGARTREELLCVNDFKQAGCLVNVATDDGSAGFKGRVSDLLKQLLQEAQFRPQTIYACGPRLMLKAVADMANEHALATQLSLEEHMSCGIGACLGCVVETKSGLKRVCKEGPVFAAKELAW